MASRTTNNKLFLLEDNMPNWHHYFNYNVDVFNDTILKVVGLNDVAVDQLQNGAILKWDTLTLKWHIVYNREK